MKKEIVARLLKAEHITFDEALELMATEKEAVSYPWIYPNYPTYPYYFQNPVTNPPFTYTSGYCETVSPLTSASSGTTYSYTQN